MVIRIVEEKDVEVLVNLIQKKENIIQRLNIWIIYQMYYKHLIMLDMLMVLSNW